MSKEALDDFLKTRCDKGFYYMPMMGGGCLAFAPSEELPTDECLLANFESKTTRRISFEEAMFFDLAPDETRFFLMSVLDFELILDLIESGEISGTTIH